MLYIGSGIQLSFGSHNNTVDSNTVRGYGISGIEPYIIDANVITNNGAASVMSY